MIVYCINLILAAILVLTPFLLILFTFRNYRQVNTDEEFKKKWGTLYEEFRNGGWGCMGYYIVFFWRRLILSVCFIILKDTPLIQNLIVEVVCLLVLVYLIIYRPYISNLMNSVQIANEACILCAYCFCGLFYYDLGLSEVFHGWMILGCVYLSYIIHIVVVLKDIIPAIIKIITKFWQRYIPNLLTRSRSVIEKTFSFRSSIS